jgi:hypothetical protein
MKAIFAQQKAVVGWLAAGVLLVSCGKDVKPKEIPGEWTVKLPYGTEKLELARDGTYQQVFTYTNGFALKADGQWIFDERENELTLNDAYYVHGRGFTNAHPQPERNKWIIRVNKTNDTLTLNLSDDGKVHFTQQAKK